MEDKTSVAALVPRLCHIVRWPDFNGYGFNLHAEKGKAGQFIGKVDIGSPAEAAGLREGDRIVEVNGINIGNENHQQVVGRVKSGGDETSLLVVDPQTDMHYKSTMKVVRGDLPEVCFMTASRDAHTKSPLTNNGTTTTTAAEPPSSGDSAMPATSAAASPHYPVRLCQLRKWADFDGYGFNLHAEKDRPGQFIGAVDGGSPAERGGLREGDRIVEINGRNVEALAHAEVIQRVKAGGDRAELLVVDREADAYYQGVGVAVSSQMLGVTVLATPPTSSGKMMGDTDINSNEPSSEPLSSATTPLPSEDPAPPTPDSPIPMAEEVAQSVETEVTTVENNQEAEAEKTAETEVTKVDDDGDHVAFLSTLPEPSVSLSDEEPEAVTAAVAEAEEPAPPSPPSPPPEEAVEQEGMESVVANGHEEEEEEERKEEGEEKKEQEEVVETVAISTVEVTLAAATINDDVAETKKEEEEEEEGGGGGEKVAAAAAAGDEEEEALGDLNAYEKVEVVAAVSCFQSSPASAAEDEEEDDDLGPSSYGMNGGATVPEPEPTPAEPQPQPVAPQPPSPVARAPEPEPEPVAVIPSKIKTGPAMGGGLELHLSAAEMKERLKARKKQDPRFHKTSFEAKSRMFEKL